MENSAASGLLAQALSVDGRCKTFDASADGYGRGEGFAVAYLSLASLSSHPLAVLQVCRATCMSITACGVYILLEAPSLSFVHGHASGL